jgi:hypothetical protein
MYAYNVTSPIITACVSKKCIMFIINFDVIIVLEWN